MLCWSLRSSLSLCFAFESSGWSAWRVPVKFVDFCSSVDGCRRARGDPFSSFVPPNIRRSLWSCPDRSISLADCLRREELLERDNAAEPKEIFQFEGKIDDNFRWISLENVGRCFNRLFVHVNVERWVNWAMPPDNTSNRSELLDSRDFNS